MTEFMVQIRRGDDVFEIYDDGSDYVTSGKGLGDVDADIALEALELLRKSVKEENNGRK